MLIATQILISIHRWDVTAFHRVLQAHRSKTIVRCAHWFSKSADGWLYPLVPILLYALSYDQTAVFTATLLLALCMERVLYLMAKKGFKRKRPANILADFRSLVIASDEFSFPSGHTSAAFLIVTTLVLIVSPAFVFGYLWAIGVGCSRVILGVHFPTDTLVGALLGSSVAAISLSYILVQ